MVSLFLNQWSFAETAPSEKPVFPSLEQYAPVDLPHDFLIWNADGLYRDADGYYRRTIHVDSPVDGHWILVFDGVYMDASIYINGQHVMTHPYGYTSFQLDLTPHLLRGSNEILVRIPHRAPNSRWYSGAGLFRNIYLHQVPETFLVPDSLYVHSASSGDGYDVSVTADVSGNEPVQINLELKDRNGRICYAASQTCRDRFSMFFHLSAPHLWSPEAPYLYTLLLHNGTQEMEHRIGFRDVRLDPGCGLFLNGQRTKLKGVCMHHDLGMLGSAFHTKAARRQLQIMKDMGVNSLRTSHNPPAREVLDLCDEMGIMVVDEFLDMWEKPKTAFDYARFFHDEVEKDAASWIRRDRNHACVLFWSIGNEIFDTTDPVRGPELTAMLSELVRKHDPEKNAFITLGSNYMPWEGGQKCGELLEAVGYNYGERLYEEHHARYPGFVIYGSETASSLSSRGIFHFPVSETLLSDEDLQCSDLGNSTTSWGTRNFSRMLYEDQINPYSMGQFIWSGMDYIGEPTPYHTRCCYFGQTDTAGFPKNHFYEVQSFWGDHPMIHLGVSWDWNPGQMIDLPVITNCPEVELFLNGDSLGRQHRDPDHLIPLYHARYVPGEVIVRGYDAQGCQLCEDRQSTPGEVTGFLAETEDSALTGDGHDLTFIRLLAVDQAGHPVFNARNPVHVSVSGPVRLLGMDNGDSTDSSGFKTDTRRLFSGRLLIGIGALDSPGTGEIRLSSPGLGDTVVAIPVKKHTGPAYPCTGRVPAAPMLPIPARKITLTAPDGQCMTKEKKSLAFHAAVSPENALSGPIEYRILTSSGVPSQCAEVRKTPDGCTVTAVGDGLFYLRACAACGDSHTRIISQLELTASGFGEALVNPYRFVYGAQCQITRGLVGPGNEHGIAFSREGASTAGFNNLDFGPEGSDTLTMPVFGLDSEPYEIRVYDGIPGEGGVLLDTLRYQKKSIWNVYQEETWRLSSPLYGVHTLCFSMDRKAHIKGFSFKKQLRVSRGLCAADAKIWGDSYLQKEDGIESIGNNVTIQFPAMDFAHGGKTELFISYRTPLDSQPVTMTFVGKNGQETRMLLNLPKQEIRTEHSFPVTVPAGIQDLSLIFLPGSQADLYTLRFDLSVPKESE